MAEKSTDLGPETQAYQQAVPRTSAERPLSVSGANNDDTEKSTPTPDDSLDDKRDYAYPTGLKKAFIVGPVTLTYFLFFLDLAVVSTATPAITSQFNSLVDVGWYGFQEISIHVRFF